MMFRAYIKDTDDLDYNDVPHKGHFVYGNLIEGGNQSNTDAIVGDLIEATDEYINPEWWCSIEKGSAEQSTGLKDANGKDIYEGDIVKSSYKYAQPKISQVIMEDGNSYILGEDLATGNEMLVSDHINEIEVIGNIHTNRLSIAIT
ncbi:YopX family protein [Levilactobacillus brevis]|nr:YopX family protein [Levilactobacillus brevis]